MLISEQKPLDEILKYLDGEKSIFLVGCKGCAEGWGSGGEKQIAEMKSTLQEQGKTITGSVLVDMLCDNALTKLKLIAHKNEINAADSVLVLTDGAGVQTVAQVLNKIVHPGCNTLSSGGAHAEWKEALVKPFAVTIALIEPAAYNLGSHRRGCPGIHDVRFRRE